VSIGKSTLTSSVLKKRKESRRRNLQFHLPTSISLAPQLRLVQNDSSYISLQDIYDDFCNANGMTREDALLTFNDRLKVLHDPAVPKVSHGRVWADRQADPKYVVMRQEVVEEIQAKMVPENVLTNVST
jgi:transformation/transcription domain-associated protein